MSNTISGPTAYPAVNVVLERLLAAQRAVLGDRLIGLYLYGSLSLGDFDPDSSDLDFLTVVDGPLPSDLLDHLAALHQQFSASGQPYADKLEGWYFDRGALRRPTPDEAPQATIGADWPFGLGQPGPVWAIERHIVREHGIVVAGPPPRTLIEPISPTMLRAATRQLLSEFWAQQLDGPDWLRTRDYQAFAILTMCRALQTLETGAVTSKPVAAAWAQKNLDPPWPALIAKSLEWRHDKREDDMGEMLAFIRWTLARAGIA